ncbi:MAG: transposase family protein [Gammaproteobacteria bacterium]
MNASLLEHVSRLKDPRIERHKRHALLDIMVLIICAVVSGVEGWEDMAAFGREKLRWLR